MTVYVVMCMHVHREEFREWTESEKAEKIVRVMDGLEVEVSQCGRNSPCRGNCSSIIKYWYLLGLKGVNQMEQLTDLKKDILMDNVLDWKKFKMMVTVCCSYVVSHCKKIGKM